jgi:hypothetical protein
MSKWEPQAQLTGPHPPQSDPMLVSYGDEGPDPIASSRCLVEAGAVERSYAWRDRFSNIEPGISVRSGMDRLNHDFFRPGEHIPRRKNEMILSSDNIYRYNGIVHFVIDMMADFVTQGMVICHPSKKLEKFYRAWWKKVQGNLVSERLVNLLFRHGVAVPKRTYATMADDDVRDINLGVAARSRPSEDNEMDFEPSIDPGKSRLPIKYTFLNPMMIELGGGDIALFAGNPQYFLRIPDEVIRSFNAPKSQAEKDAISNLPMFISSILGGGGKLVPLDREKVSLLFYKKDDWQAWSDPLILSVMKDVILYDKMKEADRAALDGSISRIRIWGLGLPEHKIQPGPGSFRKLRNQLLAQVGGGTMDLVWDASLKLTETSTDVYKFLGSAKYEPVLQAIYAGLGIPQSLTGGGAAGGMTNNALSLKTLIERLTYARNVLDDFWDREFYQLQRAMGHRKPAQRRYDMMSFSDEASEKQLWLNLFDRDIASLATVQERFGMIPEIESRQITSEFRRRDSGDLPYKTGPFTEAAPHPDALAKAAMQQGTIAPTEAGVRKKPKAKGDKSLLDRQEGQQDKQLELQKQQMDHNQKLSQNSDIRQQKPGQKDSIKSKGQPGEGRPKGGKDSSPRKTRTPKPRQAVASLFDLIAYARKAQAAIAEHVTPVFLVSLSKANLRVLTTNEQAALEELKLSILGSLNPGDPLGEDKITAILATTPAPNIHLQTEFDVLLERGYSSRGFSPNRDEVREMQAFAYASAHMKEGDDDGDA